MGKRLASSIRGRGGVGLRFRQAGEPEFNYSCTINRLTYINIYIGEMQSMPAPPISFMAGRGLVCFCICKHTFKGIPHLPFTLATQQKEEEQEQAGGAQCERSAASTVAIIPFWPPSAFAFVGVYGPLKCCHSHPCTGEDLMITR